MGVHDVTVSVYIDWDNNGNFTTAGDDISAYFQAVQWKRGIWGLTDNIARVGTLTITVDNQDRRFSPSYSAGTYYGKFKPNLPIKVEVTHGATTYGLFRGVVRAFKPRANRYGTRECVIECEDLLGVASRTNIALPRQTDRTADELLTLVCNLVWAGVAATGTITFSDVPSANDTVTIGSTVYTFKASVGATANEVLIGSDAAATADNLAAAINTALANTDTGYEAAAVYGTATTRHPDVSASVDGAEVTVKAYYRGTLGNAIALSDTGANIAVSDANLTGGTDAPSGLTSFETAVTTFSEAGDTWKSDETSGYRAMQEIVESTGTGLLFTAGDGALTFYNRDKVFKLQTVASSVTLDNIQNDIIGEVSLDDVANDISVEWRPRDTLSSGVLAKSGSVISVPGTGGGTDSSNARWNPTEDKPTADNTKMVRLAYVDLETGELAGAESLVTPLVPYTDFTVNDVSDGSGYDYTTGGRMRFSLAATGSGVEVTMRNTATGTLYVTTLQVRGVGTVVYDPVSATTEDTTSIAAYGRQTRALKLVLTPTNAETIAPALAEYWLSLLKDPIYRDTQIVFNGQTLVNGVSVFDLEVGDIITVTEYQTGVTSKRLLITGINGRLGVKRERVVQFAVRHIDDVNYGIWDDATYGKWDSAKWAL